MLSRPKNIIMHAQKMLLFLLFQCIVLNFSSNKAFAETVIKMSPQGSIQTLTAARNRIRTLRAQSKIADGEKIRVVIQGGLYVLQEPFVLAPQDSGTIKAPVVYEAAPGATPVISGGRHITSGWKVRKDGFWSTHIRAVAV
ncbi:MAG: hypothetical protein L3J59_10020 [Methylococcaceae bacterium]|nr:hypothetical protein [Methylococcaceae bacterium]